jgi:histidinol-phosphate aminotransferase
VLNKIKPPYNINAATQELALKALDHLDDVNAMIRETIQEREALMKELDNIQRIQKVFPSDANFLLVKMEGATAVYDYLKNQGIIVRNRSNIVLCEDSLRITVGTPQQNQTLIEALKNYK